MSKNKRIGRYQITKELARGGMGVVFQAYDPNFERKVAVKLLLKNLTNDPSFRARFEQEARTVALLEHPAIVPVYDLGEEWNRPFLVMRYMRGGSLKDRLQNGLLPLDEVRGILTRLAEALDKVHENGIVHRDIKPANVLFDEDEKAYVADFGIARLIVPDDVSITGTPAYMSPEQRAGQDVDQRSDVYSLGMVLLEMLTGPLPSAWRLYSPPSNEILSQLHSNPNLPPGCDAVITRALARKKKDRFASAGDLAHAFKEAIGPPVKPVKPVEPIRNGRDEKRTSRILMGVLSGLASIMLVAAILLYMFYPSAPTQHTGIMVGFTPPVDVKQNGELKSAEVGMKLYAGDVVIPQNNAGALISLACPDEMLLVTIGEERNLTVDCDDVSKEILIAQIDPALISTQGQSVLTLPSFTVRSSRSQQEQPPILLSPRNTVMTDTQPTFHWQGVAGASGYRLSLNIPGAGIWEQETSETTLVYPADAPALTRGEDNTIIIKLSTLENDTLVDETFLELMDEAALAELSEAEAEIRNLPVDENAKAYLLAQLYQQRGMKGATIAQLEQIAASGQAISADLWQQLGDLYFEIELDAQAEQQYEQALSAAEANNNKEAQALAYVGLGQTAKIFEENEKAIEYFKQAEALYREIGKTDEADKVAELRAKIEQ